MRSRKRCHDAASEWEEPEVEELSLTEYLARKMEATEKDEPQKKRVRCFFKERVIISLSAVEPPNNGQVLMYLFPLDLFASEETTSLMHG